MASLSLFNPRGAFVALEDGGYWLVGLALVCLVPTIKGTHRPERTARVILGTAGVLALVGLPLIAAVSRADLGYRYEIPAISVVYIGLLVGGGCLAVAHAKDDGHESDEPGSLDAVASTPRLNR
jgi:hypothetical protein